MTIKSFKINPSFRSPPSEYVLQIFLQMFVTRILIRRLSSASLSQAGNVIKESNKILVMAGAGLSVPSGIPDFRSPGSGRNFIVSRSSSRFVLNFCAGIYDNLKQYNLPYPEAIFDINYFSHTPQPFYTWAKEFFPGVKYHPSIGHHFIKILDEKNKLLRMFTQNIDGLEAEAGLDHDKIVAAHGSFTSASCIRSERLSYQWNGISIFSFVVVVSELI